MGGAIPLTHTPLFNLAQSQDNFILYTCYRIKYKLRVSSEIRLLNVTGTLSVKIYIYNACSLLSIFSASLTLTVIADAASPHSVILKVRISLSL
jgi:hypothetical protein